MKLSQKILKNRFPELAPINNSQTITTLRGKCLKIEQEIIVWLLEQGIKPNTGYLNKKNEGKRKPAKSVFIKHEFYDLKYKPVYKLTEELIWEFYSFLK